MDAALEALERLTRRAVWLWADHPARFYSYALGATLALSGVIVVAARRRRSASAASASTMRSLTGLSSAELAARIAATTARARVAGYRKPLASGRKFVLESGGLPFVVTQLQMAHAKEKLATTKAAAGGSTRKLHESRDAFAALEPESVVGDVGASHVAVINKFPLIDGHCVLVTREFIPQTGPMSEADLSALWQL